MSCTSQRRIAAQIEASEVRWGKVACRDITFVADVSDSLDEKFIQIEGWSPIFAKTRYAVGKGADPEIAGTTFVAVTFSTNDTAAVVAAAYKTALDGISGTPFTVTIDGAVLTIKNRFIGAVASESISTTGFTLDTDSAGVLVELGKTADAIDVTFEVSSLDVTSNQTGELIASQLITGMAATLSANFIEIDKAKYDTLMGTVVGAQVTPGGGTQVTGFGEAKLFTSLDESAGQMILHPIRHALTVRTDDYIFWLAAPIISDITFDGAAVQAMTIEFNAYLDSVKHTNINLFARGDWSQVGLDA